MYRYKQITYLGYPVHIVEAKSDAQHEVKFTLMGEKFGSYGQTKLLNQFQDKTLEAEGWKQIAAINAALFFPEGATVFSLGIEKIDWVVHENDDTARDGTYAVAEFNNLPYIATQSYIKSRLPEFRGAVTAATGLVDNGVKKVGTYASGVGFNSKSGRSIIGKKPDGTIVFAALAGVTGSSGLTIPQTQSLAIFLGMNNAVCMDGGGSACLTYLKEWKVSTSRKIKNAGGLYIRELSPAAEEPVGFKTGDKININGTFTVGNMVGTKAYITELGASIDEKYLKKV